MLELQEATLSRIVMHATKNEICFISACRGNNSAEVNAKLTEELEKDIRVLGYCFIQVKGGYTENVGTPNEHDVYETSLAVINYKDHTYHKDFAKDMLYLRYHFVTPKNRVTKVTKNKDIQRINIWRKKRKSKRRR